VTEPLTVTVLDPQTQDELQPPCEVLLVWFDTPACSVPADWVAVVACVDCGTRHALYCDTHLALAQKGRFRCRCCGEPTSSITVVSAVRL